MTDGIVHRAEGSGSAVVLVHSGVTSMADWDEVAVALSANHRVIRYDRRGFGESPAPTAGFRDLDDLVGVLDSLGVEQADIVGNSYGGRLALDLALSHPERVRRLVLLAPALARWDWGAEMHAYDEAEAAAMAAGDVDTLVRLNEDTWIRGVGRDWTPELRGVAERVSAAIRTAATNQAAVWAHELEDERPATTADRLGDVAAPVLVAVGEHDLPDFAAISERIEGDVPNARCVGIPGAAHLLPVEDAAAVIALVRGLLGDDRAGTARRL